MGETNLSGPLKIETIDAITSLTDNSGGTAGDTIVAVPAAYSQADFQSIVASLTAKINAILADFKNV